MNLEKLPENSGLRKLLSTCGMDHDIARTYAIDGAVIVECFVCPWKRVLDTDEERVVRGEDEAEVVAEVASLVSDLH